MIPRGLNSKQGAVCSNPVGKDKDGSNATLFSTVVRDRGLTFTNGTTVVADSRDSWCTVQ